MFPSLAGDCCPCRMDGNSVSLGNFGVTVSGRLQCTHCPHVFFGKEVCTMLFTYSCPTACVTIAYVVGLRSGVEMRRVYAMSRVATMKDVRSGRRFSMRKLIGKSVSTHGMSGPQRKLTISCCGQGTYPQPTGLTAINLRPEASNDSGSVLGTHRESPTCDVT